MKTTVSDVIKPTLGRLLKEFPKTFAVEAGTEVGQQLGEAGVEKYTGIRPEADLARETLGVIGPTAVLTALTTAMGVPVGRIRGAAMGKVLSDPKLRLESRQAVVDASRIHGRGRHGYRHRWKRKRPRRSTKVGRLSMPTFTVAWPKDLAGQVAEAQKETRWQKLMREPRPVPTEGGEAPVRAIPAEEESEAYELGQPIDLIKKTPAKGEEPLAKNTPQKTGPRPGGDRPHPGQGKGEAAPESSGLCRDAETEQPGKL
jgi:hypothetical protein